MTRIKSQEEFDRLVADVLRLLSGSTTKDALMALVSSAIILIKRENPEDIEAQSNDLGSYIEFMKECNARTRQ
jgi:hypothetical protein